MRKIGLLGFVESRWAQIRNKLPLPVHAFGLRLVLKSYNWVSFYPSVSTYT